MKKPLGNDWAVNGPEMAGNNEVGEEGDGMEIRDSAGREGWETTKSKVRKRKKKKTIVGLGREKVEVKKERVRRAIGSLKCY